MLPKKYVNLPTCLKMRFVFAFLFVLFLSNCTWQWSADDSLCEKWVRLLTVFNFYCCTMLSLLISTYLFISS